MEWEGGKDTHLEKQKNKSEVDSANASGTQALTLRGLSNPGVSNKKENENLRDRCGTHFTHPRPLRMIVEVQKPPFPASMDPLYSKEPNPLGCRTAEHFIENYSYNLLYAGTQSTTATTFPHIKNIVSRNAIKNTTKTKKSS